MSDTTTLTPLHERIHEIRRTITANTVEREELAEIVLLSLLSKQHTVLIGEPGVAKSFVVDLTAKTIGGAKYCDVLLSKESSIDDVLGPVDLLRWAGGEGDGKRVREIEDYMPSAHIGFLDELDKANAMVKQTLLWLINERKFKNPDTQIAPLMSMFGAGNAWPTDPALAAFYDRFVLRYITKDITRPGTFAEPSGRSLRTWLTIGSPSAATWPAHARRV